MEFSKEFFGLLAVGLVIVADIVYIWKIYKKEFKPHIFTQFVWGIVTAIVFMAQMVEGAGPGAWQTAASSLLQFLIVVFIFRIGDKDITRSDLFFFVASLSAIPLWLFTNDPLWSVMLLSLIDAMAYGPTFRKFYNRPFEESALVYSIHILKYIVSLMALSHVNITTALYPATLVIMNTVLVTMLLYRRKVLTS